MKEWFSKLPFRGKLYVIGLFSIFVTIPLSKDNVYLYSDFSIGIFGCLGALILFDVAQFRRKAALVHLKEGLSFKVVLGSIVIAASYMWFLSIIFSIVMDYTNTKNFKTVGNLDSYWHSGFKPYGNNFGCHYYVRIKNDDGSNTFCVGHIKNHKTFKSAKSQDVLLVGRIGTLGVVIDDIRLN